MLKDADSLRMMGFAGFISFERIRVEPSVIPATQGIYSVVAPAAFDNDFLEVGTGGHFKGIDPNVSALRLSEKWVPTSSILYFGRARAGASGRRGLRKRLSEYAAFGQGLPVGHKGGRFIWQLRDSAELLVCWKPDEKDPAKTEADILRAFHREHGALPFANLRF